MIQKIIGKFRKKTENTENKDKKEDDCCKDKKQHGEHDKGCCCG